MAIRMSGRGLRICGGDEEGMRDEIRICTPFDGFNMGSTEGRIVGTGPGKGSHKTLKSVYHIVHTLWISLYWSYAV
jgi:hypothetical protein